ncbi:hypothetical protein CHS0354_029788, partial [Potamilus streckersoni]
MRQEYDGEKEHLQVNMGDSKKFFKDIIKKKSLVNVSAKLNIYSSLVTRLETRNFENA